MTVQFFTREDGRSLQVIDGLRQQILTDPRVSVQPKPQWTDGDYRAAADKKVRRFEQLLGEFSRAGGTLDDARVLEIGCGAGIDCLLMSLEPVRSVVGTDMELPLFDPLENGERVRRLAREVLSMVGRPSDIDAVLRQRPLRFATMDATRLSFPDHSFDLLLSRAALEHIRPPEQALAEIGRVVRPGGLIYHSIDPFYWLKGCHKSGLVDIPWAHARLMPAEYRRFVAEREGEAKAAKRSEHLLTLNRFTLREWRNTLEAGPFEILEWKEETWPSAARLLEEHPDIRETLLDGVEAEDLTCHSIKVWMRRSRR